MNEKEENKRMKKTILWIEDFDTNQSNPIHSDTISGSNGARKKEDRKKQPRSDKEKKNEHIKKLGIFDEKFRNQIEIKDTFIEGIKYILQQHGEYDCVILDIDMNKDLQQITLDDSEDGKIWNEFFDKVYIIDKDDKDKNCVKEGKKILYEVQVEGEGRIPLEQYIAKYAGFFLVILLNALGFPKERIVIFSAYGSKNKKKDERANYWEKKFKEAAIHIPRIINKEWEENDKDSLKQDELNGYLNEKYSDGGDGYYRTRMFVFEIYNQINKYFDDISKNEDMKDKFNPIFNYCCKNSDRKLDSEQIKNMIENVMFYFPCFEPNQEEKQKIYFNALKQFAEPFEAEYDIKKINKVKENGFRIMKLFRNWSSHNLFNDKDKMNSTIFKFLFLIECLILIEQPIIENPDNSAIRNKTEKFINDLWESCRWNFPMLESDKEEMESDKEFENICRELEKDNWNLCKKRKELPKNMIDVYDKMGRDQKVSYKYLMDAFMNTYIEKNIEYLDNGCKTHYKFSCSDKQMKKELFYVAYRIIQEFAPSMMSEEEVRAVLTEKFADVIATKNKGQIMKAVMAELKGKADGKVINQVVAELCK